MNKSIIVGLCILALVVSASAEIVNFELNTVSRIVGASAQEMKDSLTMNNIDIKHATFVSDDLDINENSVGKTSLINGYTKNSFTSNDYVNYQTDKWQKNELLVIDQSKAATLNENNAIETNNPFLIYNAPGDNIHRPQGNSIVNKYSDESIIITTSNKDAKTFRDNEFTQALLCNLGHYSGKTVGQLYTQTRNKYYQFAPSYFTPQNLMSYSLFGPSFSQYTVPESYPGSYETLYYSDPGHPAYYTQNSCTGTQTWVPQCDPYEYFTHFVFESSNDCLNYIDVNEYPYKSYYDSSKRRYPSASYIGQSNDQFVLQTLESESNEFEIQSLAEQTLTVEADFSSYEIMQIPDNLSILNVAGAKNLMEEYSLVLPFKVIDTKFPFKTVISNISLISFEDPEEIIIPDLPSIENGLIVNRTCWTDTQPPELTFAHTYTEDAEIVLVTIKPVEVVNCTEGRFKLYKTAKYEITYSPYSPVLINGITAPKEMLPGEKTNISIELANTEPNPVNGTLVLKNSDEQIFIASPIITNETIYELELEAPENEGTYTYRVDFYYQNESRTYKEFQFEVKTLDAQLITPNNAKTSAEITLKVKNGLSTAIQTNIEYVLLHNGLTVETKTISSTLSPGDNTFSVTFSNLDRSNIVYDLMVGIPYQNKYKTVTGTIITEHAPVIVQSNVNIKENETYTLSPEVYDVDEDPVTSSITYPLNYNENWTSSFEDSGEYNITITANDGIKTTTNIVKLTIENTNRPPVIDVVEEIHVNEGELMALNANISDPDNLNSVSNDDNTLTITYGAPLDANGTFVPSFDDAGEMTTFVTVSDGELTDTKQVKLIIDNVNRPPNLDALTDFQVAEGTPINLKLAFDPDNQNNVTNDDSNLTFVFSGGKIRSDGGWDTTFDDSGVYPIAVEISDGEVTVNKTVTLTISNVNRPPLITAPDLIYAVGYADLSQYIVELDNQNTATNDDNELTIRYTAPFDSAGKWMPSVAGVASTTISVFDGDNTVEKFVTVILENVSQPFTQTPPVPVNDTFTAPNETAPVIDTIVPVNDTVIIPVNDTQVEIEPVTPENETEPAPQPVVTNNTIVENVTVSTGLTDVVVLPVTDENATNVITNTTQNTTQQTAQNITQPQNTTQTSQNATQQTDTFETTTYSIPFIPLSQPIVPVEGLGVEVFVNSKKVSESDSVKVKPGKEVKVKVELENRDNVSKDVSVSAEVGDLDEDGKDSFILLPGARDEFKLIFEIPRLTDDDNYPLKVLVNDKETKEWNVVLKVDKPAHELSIRYFSIDPIVCGQVSTELKVRVENTGKNDEEGVLELVGESVGLSEKISFELEQGESKAFTRTVSAPEGSHEVSARVVYGKKSVLSKTSFTSSVCKAEQAVSTQSEPGKERFAFLSQQKANIVAESAPVEDIFSFVFLTVLTVFALLLFVFIVPPLFRG